MFLGVCVKTFSYFSHKKVKERREKLKLTQEQLSQLAAVSRVHIADIERGKKSPRADTLAKLSNALRVKINYFFLQKGGEKNGRQRRK